MVMPEPFLSIHKIMFAGNSKCVKCNIKCCTETQHSRESRSKVKMDSFIIALCQNYKYFSFKASAGSIVSFAIVTDKEEPETLLCWKCVWNPFHVHFLSLEIEGPKAHFLACCCSKRASLLHGEYIYIWRACKHSLSKARREEQHIKAIKEAVSLLKGQ